MENELIFIIWSNILKYQYLRSLSEERLASYLGVTTRTLSNYKHDPGTISLGQIQNFVCALGISIDDLTKA